MAWDSDIDIGFDCLCLQERYGSGDVWEDKNHKEHKMSQMDKRYMQNCINYLLRKLKTEELLDCCKEYIEERIYTLESFL
ncbi:hypothetical protein NO1_1219 [Candidatus Termititenax aidoneus]|uniref:Uncharacterized protein n=1 Tax=Termititenax aidoneus TaxID=2218524 RepID=A0A388TB58_TERA1|nr:hypothetical protein NO1_1219 [Candidatus Termititenax aidoneus]